MLFRHGIEKVPFSQDCLENISFEPSWHPSVLDELSYRDSFFDLVLERLFWAVAFQKVYFLAGMDMIQDFLV